MAECPFPGCPEFDGDGCCGRHGPLPPQWVRTQDRLPAQKQWVLALVGSSGKKRPQRMAVLQALHPQAGVHDDDEFGWFDEDHRDYVWPVTHWRELPEPPNDAQFPEPSQRASGNDAKTHSTDNPDQRIEVARPLTDEQIETQGTQIAFMGG